MAVQHQTTYQKKIRAIAAQLGLYGDKLKAFDIFAAILTFVGAFFLMSLLDSLFLGTPTLREVVICLLVYVFAASMALISRNGFDLLLGIWAFLVFRCAVAWILMELGRATNRLILGISFLVSVSLLWLHYLAKKKFDPQFFYSSAVHLRSDCEKQIDAAPSTNKNTD